MLANTDLFRGQDKQKTSDIFVMDFPLLLTVCLLFLCENGVKLKKNLQFIGVSISVCLESHCDAEQWHI